MYSVYKVELLPGIDMVMESLAVLGVNLLQFSVAPFSAVRLFPVKMRVELMQEESLVWLSVIFTPLTIRVNAMVPEPIDTVSSPVKKEPVQKMIFPGSLQV